MRESGMHAFNCIGGEATRMHAWTSLAAVYACNYGIVRWWEGKLVHPSSKVAHLILALVSVHSSKRKVKINGGSIYDVKC